MKKILSATFVIAAMVVGGYNAHMNQQKNGISELALKNVEALSQNEKEKVKTCDTGSTPIYNVITCPLCHAKAGADGTKYFRIEGNQTSYKLGFEGTFYYCDCNGHRQEEYTAETKSCS